jgi:lipopolysaccharide export system permease protein
MKILDLYIVKNFFSTFLMMFLLFIPIGVLVDISEKIDKFKEYDLSFSQVLEYYLDFIWYYGYFLIPIFVFLSVIWFTSKLSNNSEIVAILSSGISYNRYMKPFILCGLVISSLTFVSGMFIVPKKNKSFNEFQFKYLSKNKKDRNISKLFKQINKNDYVYVSSYNPTRNQAYNFSYEVFEKNELKEKIFSHNIRWIEEDSLYRLTDYFKRKYVGDDERIESKKIFDTVFNFSIDDLSPVTYQAKTLNLFELNKFINIEKASGSPLLSSHILERNKRYTLPITILILTILAVAVASNKKRGGIGLNLAFGIILAFIFIFFDKLFSVLVSKSDLNPFIGAWLPNFVFLFITFYILKIVKK